MVLLALFMGLFAPPPVAAMLPVAVETPMAMPSASPEPASAPAPAPTIDARADARSDVLIAQRLRGILRVLPAFQDVTVQVEHGVVTQSQAALEPCVL